MKIIAVLTIKSPSDFFFYWVGLSKLIWDTKLIEEKPSELLIHLKLSLLLSNKFIMDLSCKDQ